MGESFLLDDLFELITHPAGIICAGTDDVCDDVLVPEFLGCGNDDPVQCAF